MSKRARMIVALALVPAALSAAPADDGEEARIREKVRQVRHSDTDAWRKVPWVTSLLEARRTAREEGRPVFLFTLDGNLDSGRC
jgi:hypothetical protein